MNSIIMLKGKVKYTLTLDPSVWIFDDRKLDMDVFFEHPPEQKDETEAYTKAVSKHWDREIQEGAVFPPTLKTEKKFKKQELVNGTFGILFAPFLANASPTEEATNVSFKTKDALISFSLEEAQKLIFGFSQDGKPLREDGPIYVYLADGSNRNNPIKYVEEIIVT
ncbi:peptidyl-prolyl cis-trans isomerase [Priestia megaterium]|uniref:peptidyl-prolyl cis-trans isomerase n=1 Tax=Priestia megaterium TaxID=1404 RepID=UPI00159642E7|nr:peptidyl-prolyl cis-trans isomerase [Priestia megaterium]